MSWTRNWPRPWAAATVTRPNNESRETFMRVKGKTASRRQSLLIIATLVFVVLGLVYAAWWWMYASHFEDTDNAYVQGNLVQVTAQIPGTVVAINADETERVERGGELIALDSGDTDLASRTAQAALAQALRQTGRLFAP